MEYETIIGLEVHVHLKTKTKAFCGCSTQFGNEPNSQTCPVCLGFPGSLPVLNSQALDYAIKVGLALNCQVQGFTKFDRKNYFYPDLPKNYQISQYDLPIAREGFLDITLDSRIKRIGILRVHLEEDAGKLIHKENVSLVDFNRSGMPLLEIVSHPEINSPLEAQIYLTTLKTIIQYLGVSDCDMEKGSLRCDANISLKKKGEKELGVKSEIKNMNSFKAVKEALGFEVNRQSEVLSQGGAVVQETRLWDERSGETFPMRSKEEAKDYRYFPEPDLPLFLISQEEIKKIKSTIPELPKEKINRFLEEYGLSEYDAGIIIASLEDAEFAEKCFKLYPEKNKKQVANWLVGPLTAIASTNNLSISEIKLPAGNLLELIEYVKNQEISNLIAKAVLEEMVNSGKTAKEIIQGKNLTQISDEDSLAKSVEEVISENTQTVQSYKQGKSNAIMFLVGQVMKKTQGKANPKVAQEILKRRLKDA